MGSESIRTSRRSESEAKIDPLRLKRIWEKHDLHGRHPCGWGGEKVKQKEQKLEGYIKTLLVIEREEEL
ncbi:unnamed protein product [marine sediment metagenome]|uniref:Uncharacterized protein n=1 Tax=marine sediment metagenome TaxID=412755 RepID=X1NW25_9ZZZZ